jgi:hypothetical protein
VNFAGIEPAALECQITKRAIINTLTTAAGRFPDQGSPHHFVTAIGMH